MHGAEGDEVAVVSDSKSLAANGSIGMLMAGMASVFVKIPGLVPFCRGEQSSQIERILS
jgi:hypothetical protein